MAFETEFDRLSMLMQGRIASGWDLATFFSDAAVQFIYKKNGTRYTLTGIFDDAYQGVNVADAEFASSQPMLSLPTSALPCQPAEGDTVIHDKTIYRVREFKADGTGVTVMMLQIETELDAP